MVRDPNEARRRTRSSGSVILIVLAVIAIVGVLAAALIGRGVGSGATGAWSRDHVVLQMLAESATEEMYAALQRQAATPGDPVFLALRLLPAGTPLAPIALDGLRLTRLPGDLDVQQNVLGGKLTCESSVTVRRVEATSVDPLEVAGLIVLEAGVRLTRPRRPVVMERVRVERTFRVARVTPPRPLDQAALFVVKTGPKDLPAYGGKMACALGRGASQTLLDLMTQPSKAGFQAVPATAEGAIRRALAALAPIAMERRAHMVVDTVAQFRQLLASRARQGGALTGVIHARFDDFISLELPHFRGQCLLSFTGPVEVKEVTLDDPMRDSLTILSAKRIVVSGRAIEASLISPSDDPDSLVFQQRATVKGTVVCGRFPRFAGLSWQELGSCRFAASPDLASGLSPDAWPDPTLMARYVALISPYPVSVQHARENQTWVLW